MNVINNYESNIMYSGAYERDVVAWPNSSKIDNDDMALFKKYLEDRLIYMDKYIEKL
jgi:hypothetical protein